jgi:hypothetical protein
MGKINFFMSCPFGRPSCFLQVSLIAERAIRAHHNERKTLASGLYIHARNGIFRDRRSHIKLCLDELLDAQSGQASLIGTIAPFPLPYRSRSCTLWLLWLGRLRKRSYVDARQLQQFFERLYLIRQPSSSEFTHPCPWLIPDRLA